MTGGDSSQPTLPRPTLQRGIDQYPGGARPSKLASHEQACYPHNDHPHHPSKVGSKVGLIQWCMAEVMRIVDVALEVGLLHVPYKYPLVLY